MTDTSSRTVRELSAAEICTAFRIDLVGASKKLRTYRALTLDPYFPAALRNGLVNYAALPVTSPYCYTGAIAAIEYAAITSPPSVRWDFEEMRKEEQYPLIGTPTYLSEGTEFYDNTASYQKSLDAVLAAAGSLDVAFAGLLTLLGWGARSLVHRELGEYQVSDEIFHPERFTTTQFYEEWLDSTDVQGKRIEAEFVDRLRQGDVALLFEWDAADAFSWRDGGWLRWHQGVSSPARELEMVRVIRKYPDCCLLPTLAAEKYLKFSLV